MLHDGGRSTLGHCGLLGFVSVVLAGARILVGLELVFIAKVHFLETMTERLLMIV